MAVQKICRMGNPVLRQKNAPIGPEEFNSPEFAQILQDMHDTMTALGGIGIAAPQIGVNKQIALIEIKDENTRYPEATALQPTLVFCNPEITVIDESLQQNWEGCLSVPGLRGLVVRPQSCKIDFMDINGHEQSLVAQGFLACVFQHEIDHLFGQLYVDKIKDKTKLVFEEEFETYILKDSQRDDS